MLSGCNKRFNSTAHGGVQNTPDKLRDLLPPPIHPMATLIPASDADEPPSRRNMFSWNEDLRVGRPPAFRSYESAGQNNKPVASGFMKWNLDEDAQVFHSAENRAKWFQNLDQAAREPQPMATQQARTIRELLELRAFHGDALRRHSLGTALGMRTKQGKLTASPAIIVFVSRKVHEQWLMPSQLLPSTLTGPRGTWCDVDVVEFSYSDTTSALSLQPMHIPLVEGLRGQNPQIGPGSQVASEEMYGTLGVIVRSLTDNKALGFLTNHHVAVDFGQPHQLMYHPLPPSHGPGRYLGSVERASSFTSDVAWYGIFSSRSPATFVRADGAFIPFHAEFDVDLVTTEILGFGPIGPPLKFDLDSHISEVVGRKVVKVGRSSGLTCGRIMGYSVEYHDNKGNSFVTDFLILGENGKPFDMEGDSGSAILMLPREDEGQGAYEGLSDTAETRGAENESGGGETRGAARAGPSDMVLDSPSAARPIESSQAQLDRALASRARELASGAGVAAKEEQGGPSGPSSIAPRGSQGELPSRLPRPVGLIWGGTSNKGKLKLRSGQQPESWTSGVDLARLLELLQLEAVTSEEEKKASK